MTAKECIKGRRSIRKFTDQPIDHSLLEEIIETASYSPSWKNTQIARYIAVEGELKDKIADECTSAFPNNGAIIKGAPMLIVIAAIKTDAAMKGTVLSLQEGGLLADVRCRHRIPVFLPRRLRAWHRQRDRRYF